jgi:hypothetical protein
MRKLLFNCSLYYILKLEISRCDTRAPRTVAAGLSVAGSAVPGAADWRAATRPDVWCWIRHHGGRIRPYPRRIYVSRPSSYPPSLPPPRSSRGNLAATTLAVVVAAGCRGRLRLAAPGSTLGGSGSMPSVAEPVPMGLRLIGGLAGPWEAVVGHGSWRRSG